MGHISLRLHSEILDGLLGPDAEAGSRNIEKLLRIGRIQGNGDRIEPSLEFRGNVSLVDQVCKTDGIETNLKIRVLLLQSIDNQTYIIESLQGFPKATEYQFINHIQIILREECKNLFHARLSF